MTIRVLHVVISLETGGLENGVVNLVNRHDTAGFKVDILCLSAKGELTDRIQSAATEVFFYHPTTSVKDSAAIIRNHLRTHHYDIVHSHGFSTMLASYLALLLRRQTVLINGEHGVIYADKWWQRRLQRFLFNQVATNLSVSALLARHIATTFGVALNRFCPIINGVDVEKFQPDAGVRARQRAALGLSDEFVVGTVGRLVPVKDYGSLIRAFAVVCRQQTAVRLVLVGGGPEEAALRALAQQLQIQAQVLFLGRRDDVAALMNVFDCFALSSLTEGLSNTVLEAMATGLPVVATRVGGNPEIVEQDKSGLLVEAGDVDGLATALLRMIQDSAGRAGMAHNALQFATTQCSIQTMVDNYERVYRQCVPA